MSKYMEEIYGLYWLTNEYEKFKKDIIDKRKSTLKMPDIYKPQKELLKKAIELNPEPLQKRAKAKFNCLNEELLKNQ